MKRCRENIVMKALAEDMEPHYSTISDFIKEKGEEIKNVFKEVLLVCDDLKLIEGSTFAIDGCKITSNASKEWSGTHEELEKKFLSMHQPKLGSGGDEIPSNITDPESAKIKGPHGVIQGYNGIAVADSTHQVIVAAEAFGSGAEVALFEPMLTQVEETMGELTGKEKSLEKALVLGDTGYFSEENLKVAEEHEVAVLIPDQQFRTRDERFDSRTDQNKDRYPLDQFTFNEETNSYSCPEGKELSYKRAVKLNRNRGKKYQAKSSDCKGCPS